MAVMERLGDIIQVRRRTALAKTAHYRERVRVGLEIGYGYANVVPPEKVKVVTDKAEALQRNLKSDTSDASLEEMFAAAKNPDASGLLGLRARVGQFLNEWRVQLVRWGYNEDGTHPWYADNRAVESEFVPLEFREGALEDRYVILKKQATLAAESKEWTESHPSDYGAPLPPVEPGESGPEPSGPAPARSRPPVGASLGGASTTTVIVLVVAAVAALGGFLLLRKGT